MFLPKYFSNILIVQSSTLAEVDMLGQLSTLEVPVHTVYFASQMARSMLHVALSPAGGGVVKQLGRGMRLNLKCFKSVKKRHHGC